MTNSSKYTGIALGLLGGIALAVGGCSGSVGLGGGSTSVGGSQSGAGGASGGSFGAGGNACALMECFRAVECVQDCGGPVLTSGCCACENGTIDRGVSCNGAGGNTGLGGAGGSSSTGGRPSMGGTGAGACSMTCQVDADCACGVNSATRACAIGRVECIDITQQCPDFCTGITGRLRMACVNQECSLANTCGTAVCKSNQYCCNPLSNACTPIGASCALGI
jgi:hypothetical protein